MAIEYSPSGNYGALVGDLAKKAGEAEFAKRVQEQTQKLQLIREEQQLKLAAEREAVNLRLAAETKLKQIDFQMELEKYKRSKEWEIEKMQLTSQIDFQEEEKKRLLDKQQYETDIKSIDEAIKSGEIDSNTGDQLKKVRQLTFFGAEGAASQVMRPKSAEEVMMDALTNKVQGTGAVTGKTPQSPRIVSGSVTTKAPPIRQAVVQFEGKTIIQSDDGTQQEINPNAPSYMVKDSSNQTISVNNFEGLVNAINEGKVTFIRELGTTPRLDVTTPAVPINKEDQELLSNSLSGFKGETFGNEPMTGGSHILPPEWKIKQSYDRYLKNADKLDQGLFTYEEWVEFIREKGFDEAYKYATSPKKYAQN